MNSYGDRRASLWITEFGWSSSGPPSPYRALRDQPARVAGLIRYLQRSRYSLGLGAAFYFDWKDLPSNGARDYWGLHTGLFTRSGRPRPALRGFVSAARVLNR